MAKWPDFYHWAPDCIYGTLSDLEVFSLTSDTGNSTVVCPEINQFFFNFSFVGDIRTSFHM